MSMVSLTVLIGILAAIALSPLATKAGQDNPLLHRPDRSVHEQSQK